MSAICKFDIGACAPYANAPANLAVLHVTLYRFGVLPVLKMAHLDLGHEVKDACSNPRFAFLTKSCSSSHTTTIQRFWGRIHFKAAASHYQLQDIRERRATWKRRSNTCKSFRRCKFSRCHICRDSGDWYPSTEDQSSNGHRIMAVVSLANFSGP